jgi:type IV secretory pathway VirJ component
MKCPLLLGLLLLGSPLAFALDGRDVAVNREDFADLGNVTVISNPTVPPRDLVLVFDAGATVPAPLFEMARQGHLIAHIPLQQFLDRVGHDECLSATTLLDVFSQHLQQEFRFARYQRPLLVGIDAAAAFALATLAQAPNGLFQAGFGIRFQAELSLPAALCSAVALKVQPLGARPGGRQAFRLGTIFPATPWLTLGNLNELNATLPAASVSATAGIDDLPLVELPPLRGPSSATLIDTFGILVSGDGGWANIDKDIGETLSRAGLPVVGWNSLQYFWRKKTPEQASADLAQVIAHYRQNWRRSKVVLIGFSLGADVLPFMLSRLPADARAAVVDTVLLSLSHQVDFEFHVADWLGTNNSQARTIAPELAKLAGLPLLCVYGKEDDDSLCADRPSGLEVIMLPGDHHFDGDYQTATRLILEHLAKTQH